MSKPKSANQTTGIEWTNHTANFYALDKVCAPLKKPSKIFIDSMSDFFHENITDENRYECLVKMVFDYPQHIFQLLTKRPQNALCFFEWVDIKTPLGLFGGISFENIWLGVTAENQECADERIPTLLDISGIAVRFASCEPLFDTVNLSPYLGKDKLNWVITGGESGRKARPTLPANFYWLKDQCTFAKIPFFFKQWGEFNERGEKVGKDKAGSLLDGVEYKEFPNTANTINITNS